MTDPSDMTDAELLEAVTIELLGAAEVSRSRESSQVEWFEETKPSRGLHRLALDWSGIGLVVEALMDIGFHHELTSEPEIGHVSVFTKLSSPTMGGSSGDPVEANDYVRDPARAVMEAALAAVRSVEG